MLNPPADGFLPALGLFLEGYFGKPAEQLGMLRSAFDATMGDKQFLEDAEKARLDISPLSGTKVQDLVQKLYATPKDVIVRARQAITP